MTGRILSTPPAQVHECEQPKATYLDHSTLKPIYPITGWTLITLSIPQGTTWQCDECDRVWTAVWDVGYVGYERNWVSLPKVEWRAETKRELKARLRAEKKAPKPKFDLGKAILDGNGAPTEEQVRWWATA